MVQPSGDNPIICWIAPSQILNKPIHNLTPIIYGKTPDGFHQKVPNKVAAPVLGDGKASGGAPTDDRPYRQNFGFDAFNNMTSRNGKSWNLPISFNGSLVNNRLEGWQYDEDGRETVTNSLTYLYDAAGQAVRITSVARAPSWEYFSRLRSRC
jgi:hypothetical protein